MFDLLDNLRKRPAYVRRQIAVALSSGVSILVFSMWVGAWGATNESVSPQTIDAKPPGTVIAETFRGMKDEGLATWQQTMKQLEAMAPKENLAGVGTSTEVIDDTITAIETPLPPPGEDDEVTETENETNE